MSTFLLSFLTVYLFLSVCPLCHTSLSISVCDYNVVLSLSLSLLSVYLFLSFNFYFYSLFDFSCLQLDRLYLKNISVNEIILKIPFSPVHVVMQSLYLLFSTPQLSQSIECCLHASCSPCVPLPFYFVYIGTYAPSFSPIITGS